MGLRVQSLGFKLEGSGFRGLGLGFRVYGSGLSVDGIWLIGQGGWGIGRGFRIFGFTVSDKSATAGDTHRIMSVFASPASYQTQASRL